MKKLICKLMNHSLEVVKTFDYTSRCCHCKRCGQYFAMNDNVKAFLPWDGEFSALYKWSPYKYDLTS